MGNPKSGLGRRLKGGSRIAIVATEPKRVGNWTPGGKAERMLLRKEYLETTPGQRVEQAMVLSHELSKLAARGLERVRAEHS